MGKARKPNGREDDVLVKQLPQRMAKFEIQPTVEMKLMEKAVLAIKAQEAKPNGKHEERPQSSPRFMRPKMKRFHGMKASPKWFPERYLYSECRDRFGYLSKADVRNATKLGFNPLSISLLDQLGGMMGNSGREAGIGDAPIPAGYTYFGQFVDHDITFDVSSSIHRFQSATSVDNMRTPKLDLDSLYGEGPALQPYLYDFTNASPTAVKFKLGINQNVGPGGPGGAAGAAGMVVQADADLPRIGGSNTAAIGDPRNDENLIVSQLHMAMLKFHNKVVDLLVLADFQEDIFVEAKKIVTHHYQWAVVEDFLVRICGQSAVKNALDNVNAPVRQTFRMPVEFAVGAYRFGHSMIRDTYWLNFNFPNQPLSDVFDFIRNPRLPVLSNWVVDFNAFFDTGISVPVFNNARKIDSVLSNGLETLPGGSGITAILAARNLRRGLALGLPSGQGMAQAYGVTPLTTAELTAGLPADEVALLNSNGGLLLNKTPLWYYTLREAAVLENGNQLGPVGARIVADTFIRMLKHDANSYLNVTGGFTPFLPSASGPNEFNVQDLIVFSGANQP